MDCLDNITNNLYLLLLSLNRRFFNPHELLKNLNIPLSHAKVLFYLIHNGPAPISKIAEKLCISRPNMTPIIDKLVEGGYVVRFYSEYDRRVILIKHTENACGLFKSLEKTTKDSIEEKLKTLSDDELQEFSQSLNTLLNSIKNI